MLMELSVVEQRYHAVMEVVSGGVLVAEVAQRYEVSRKTVRTWLRRYWTEGLAGLAERSRSSVTSSPGRARRGVTRVVGMSPDAGQ
jgi:transposase